MFHWYYKATYNLGQIFLASALFSKSVQDMKVKFDMTTRHKVVLGCLQAAHAHDFLLDIPIDWLGQHMSPAESHTILKYRHMIPLFSIDEVCCNTPFSQQCK